MRRRRLWAEAVVTTGPEEPRAVQKGSAHPGPASHICRGVGTEPWPGGARAVSSPQEMKPWPRASGTTPPLCALPRNPGRALPGPSEQAGARLQGWLTTALCNRRAESTLTTGGIGVPWRQAWAVVQGLGSLVLRSKRGFASLGIPAALTGAVLGVTVPAPGLASEGPHHRSSFAMTEAGGKADPRDPKSLLALWSPPPTYGHSLAPQLAQGWGLVPPTSPSTG